MATSQPQPQPQQPIYAADLNVFLERHFVRITNYFDDRFRGNDARMDGILAQMKLDRQDSLTRDNELREGLKGLVDSILRLGQKLGEVDARVTAIEATQQTMLQLMKDLHAEAMGAINDLRKKDIE